MRVAVTGGAGYIGSKLAKNLLDEGYDVVALDNQSTGNYNYLRHLKTAKLEIIEGDIRNPLDLDKVLGPEAVAAALETFRRRPALGFSDCLLIELARKAGHLPLGTFDRDLSKLDGATRL